MTNPEFVDSLRQVADFYAANPDLPLPHNPTLKIYSVTGREELAAVARILVRGGKVTKEQDETFYRVSRDFGGVSVEAVEYRNAVCRIVGTERKTVKRLHVLIPAITEEREEEQEVPIYDCSEALLPEAA